MLIDFLMGLNNEFESLRGQILAMDPLSTVNQAFAKVHQDEIQKNVASDVYSSVDAIAMIAQKPNSAGNPWSNATKQQVPPNVWKRDVKRPKNDRVLYFCDYCNKAGHTRDYCFKLKAAKHGGSTGSGNSKRYAAHVEEACLPFEVDTPFDTPDSTATEPVVDPRFAKAFMKEMFKVIQATPNDSETSKFAGLFN
ncbi:hypothetical protein RND81_14G251800 [Saponaria officinalis]|uniref:Uncharacterized protein n=1 Tax=Saponaria officinalis TaxID=3572 RepID=A0AAW1GTJ1_SAPOF